MPTSEAAAVDRDPLVPTGDGFGPPQRAGTSAGLMGGQRVGAYVLQRVLGRGAQGTVYLAKDTRLGRLVALKVLEPDHDDEVGFHARLRREAEAAALVRHPGLCTIHEAGVADGQPFLAMEYVEGPTLREEIRKGAPRDRADLLRRVRLVEAVGLALNAAHQCGLVHRDVKPGNILLRPDGTPVLCDFGIARVAREDHVHRTLTGDARGTPAYMAPEVLISGGRAATPASDVFALGVVLYELVAGQRPFDSVSWAAMGEGILRGEITRPPALPTPLWIVLTTALDRSPARRYASAGDMAEDLRRFREHLPLRARPPSPWVRGVRFVQRHRSASLLATALLLGTTGFALQQRGAARAAERATRRVELERARADRRAYAARLMAAASLLERHRAGEAREQLEDCPPEQRAWEWRHLQLASDDADEAHWIGKPLHGLAVDPSGSFAALTGSFRSWIFDLGSRSILKQFKHDAQNTFVSISPRGSRIAFVEGRHVRLVAGATYEEQARHDLQLDGIREAVFLDEDRLLVAAEATALHVVDLRSDPPTKTMAPLGGRPTCLRPIVGGRDVVVGMADGQIVLWNMDGAETRTLGRLDAEPLALAVKENRVLVGGYDGQAIVLTVDASSPPLRLRGHRHRVSGVCFLEGAYATAGRDTLRIWSSDGTELHVLLGHVNWRCVVPRPGGLLSTGQDGTMRVWSWPPRRARSDLLHHGGAVWGLDFTPDGNRLVVANVEGRAYVVDVATASVLTVLRGHEGTVRKIAVHPGGHLVASAGSGSGVLLHEVETGALAAHLPGPRRDVRALAWSPDGTELAVLDREGLLRVYDVETRRQVALFDEGWICYDLAWHPDGEHLLVACRRGIAVWHRSSGELARRIASDRRILSLDVSPDGQRIATGTAGGGEEGVRMVRIRRWPDGSVLAEQPDHTMNVLCVRYAPDGARVATTSSDGSVRVRDGLTAETLLTHVFPQENPMTVTWSADGTSLAVGLSAGTVTLLASERPPARRRVRSDVDLDEEAGARTLLRTARDALLRGELEHADALEQVERAAALLPGSALLEEVQVGAWYRMGRFSEAVRAALRVRLARLQAGRALSAETELWLAMAYAAEGRAAEAAVVLARSHALVEAAGAGDDPALSALLREAESAVAAATAERR